MKSVGSPGISGLQIRGMGDRSHPVRREILRHGWGSYVRRETLQSLAYSVIVAAITAFIVFPVLFIVLSAFKPPFEIFTIPPRLFPTRLTTENFVTFINAGNFVGYLKNSLYVASWTAVLATALSAMAAYSLARFQYKGKTALGYFILLTYMFPPILVAIPLFLLFARLHLTDTYTGLILADTALSLPFCLWLLRDFFGTIPVQIEHAARIDGASILRTAMSVTLPLSLPGIGAALMFSFVVAWGDYLLPLVLVSRDELKTLPLGIATLVGTYTSDWGMVMAAATLVTVPPLAAVLLFHRFLLRGFGVASE